MSESADTVIVLTTGKMDRGTRATLAFAWGCTALAMGQTVTVFLTMDGTVWSTRGAAHGVAVAGFEDLGAYIEQFTELGGKILVCAPCTQYYCGFDAEAGLIPEASLSGLATVVSLAGEHTKMLVF